ncbi:hypothetical protein BH11BAC6_BH11BAC6_04760 [soil metagenome]
MNVLGKSGELVRVTFTNTTVSKAYNRLSNTEA